MTHDPDFSSAARVCQQQLGLILVAIVLTLAFESAASIAVFTLTRHSVAVRVWDAVRFWATPAIVHRTRTNRRLYIHTVTATHHFCYFASIVFYTVVCKSVTLQTM